MSLAKDESLTVVITGKADAVMKARKAVVQKLQTQVRFDYCVITACLMGIHFFLNHSLGEL